MTRYKTLLTEQPDDGILTVTLHRPERRNAMTPEMREELIDVFESTRDSVEILILTGAGAAFCAGLDLTALETIAASSPAEQEADARRIAHLFRTLYTFPAPTIAAVNGPAIAGGTGLATLCDFTLAAPEAKFGYTEVRIGFIPAIVSAFLAIQIGEKQAKGLLLSGRVFDAHRSHALGLVDEIVEPASLLTRAHALAQELLANSSAAMRQTKALFLAQSLPALDHSIEAAIAANAEARQHPDFREGVRAFLEKRKPQWVRGK
ncbi:enoyl-CoA hydratase/isomerase family protein [Terracidiphilus gabretensis]|jgi:methylglutaconyl-CoA hydratase|uniref:enoyl-CoA hydratase/isomerase family protein n=1 Tax=Terracidiphilus gabretensis TaxID=1577687 RepID=UPI00071BC595|nr:enoyl-CoA hydratase-related protein [Terracidiphilus gabretensis]